MTRSRKSPRLAALAVAASTTLGASLARAEPAPLRFCGTPAVLADAMTRRHLARDRWRPRLDPPQEKLVRDSHGEWANVLASTNFVVKWGLEGPWNATRAAELLDAFEAAWAVEIETMGLAQPVGTTEYKLNVYISETGGPLADNSFGAYTGIDAEGYPFVAMRASTSTFDTPSLADFTRVTAAHEFFHAVAYATEAYDISSNWGAYWYWEATADWITAEVHPDSTWARGLVPYYAVQPHLSLDFVEYPAPGADEVLQMHHYGAAIFPRYLSEHVADGSVVRDSWMTAGPADDPLAVLENLLTERGADVASLFADFAAHNVRFDYAHADVYLDWMSQVSASVGDKDQAIAAEVAAEGSGGWRDAPEPTRPQALAYNVIRMAAPTAGDLRIAVQADAQGSEGTPARIRARMVRELEGSLEYVVVEGDDTAAEATIHDVGEEIALYLVVTAEPDERLEGETFGYRYAMEYQPEPPPDDPEREPDGPGHESSAASEGCACRSAGTSARTPALAALALGAALSAARRRRRALRSMG